MKRKHATFAFKELKENGTGSAVFATLNVIDKDGDLTPPGAFGEQMAKLSPAHDWGAPSIGIARVFESGNEAIADFRFNLEMAAAKEWYQSLKFNFDNGVPQEFSYGFDVLSSRFEEKDGRTIRVLERLKVHEVSPVMVGAGVGTRLVNMKGAGDLRMDEHGLAVVETVDDYLDRCKALAALRRKEGRTLSRATVEKLSRIHSDLTSLLAIANDAQTVEIDTDGKSAIDFNLLEAEVLLTGSKLLHIGG